MPTTRPRHHVTETPDFVLHSSNAAEALVNPVRQNASGVVLRDRSALGIDVVPTDDQSPVRLAALRVRTGLELPDCCVLDVAQQHRAAVATFDDRLARAARDLGLDVVGAESPGGA